MKSEIRNDLLSKRRSLQPEDVARRSALVMDRLRNHPSFVRSEGIGFYASCDNEVDTYGLLDEVLKEGRKAYFPYIVKGNRELLFFQVQGRGELTKGAYGIPSPPFKEGGDCFSRIDFLIIPGVAYDARGGRIGYGGGFYDRTLGRKERLPIIAAPAFDFQLVTDMPVEKHDIRVNMIFTESRTIECGV